MKKLKKNLLYNISYQILIVILPLITAPYISRVLGAENLGIYSYSNSIAYYFLMIAMLGISNHGNRTIAASKSNWVEMNKNFNSIYFLQFFLFLLSTILYFLYCIIFVNEYKLIFLLQSIYVISGMFDIGWLFFGLEEFKITVTRNIIVKILTFVLIILFVKNTSDLWKYALIMSSGTFFSQIYLMFSAKKYIKYELPKINDILANLKPALILFIPVLAYSIYKVMDKIMLGSMSTYYEVGLYQNAEKIINIPMGIITAIGTVMLPRMTSIVSSGNVKEMEKYINNSFKLVSLLSISICFGLFGVSNILSPIFFGKEFYGCSTLIKILSFTIIFISWANVIRTQYLIPKHMDKIYISSTIIGAVINFTANFILIKNYNSLGAAIGTLLAEFSVMFYQMIYTQKELKFFNMIYKYLPIVFFGIIMGICVNKTGEILGEHIYTLFFQIICGIILFSIPTFIFIKKKDSELFNLIILNSRRKK